MYLRQNPNKDTGRIHLSIVDSYYDRDKKMSRQFTVEKIGYLDVMEKEHDDPIAHFTKRVEVLKAEKAAKKAPVVIEFDPGETIDKNSVYRKNFGYAVISRVYHELGIHTYLINKQRHSKEEYSANNIMKLLVNTRIISPSSKKKSFEEKERYFENSDFSLDDVYRCLSLFARNKNELLKRLHDNVASLYGRDTGQVYYDVTNYHFEIDGPVGYVRKKKGEEMRVPDDLRKKGVAKNHVPDPIVQMGMFIDNNGFPITFDIFPGNTNDCMTYRPGLKKIKADFGIRRSVVVADKGINTSDNIWYTLSAKDGYVFSKSIRGASAEFKRYILDEDGYEWIGTDYKKKSRRRPRTISVNSVNGKKIDKTVHEKQVVFYSEKYKKRARAERDLVIAKARDMIANPANYTRATSYGASGYIMNVAFDKDTGEILPEVGKALELDTEKIKEAEKYDGYYMILTSEMHESDERIIEIYRGLWKIEESFRIQKTDLGARPIYVSTKEHIEAHFLTCFISLLILRIIQMKTENRHSAGSIIESLGNAECTFLKQNFYLFDYSDDVLDDLGAAFNIDFSKRVRSISEIKNIFADTKKQK